MPKLSSRKKSKQVRCGPDVLTHLSGFHTSTMAEHFKEEEARQKHDRAFWEAAPRVLQSMITLELCLSSSNGELVYRKLASNGFYPPHLDHCLTRYMLSFRIPALDTFVATVIENSTHKVHCEVFWSYDLEVESRVCGPMALLIMEVSNFRSFSDPRINKHRDVEWIGPSPEAAELLSLRPVEYRAGARDIHLGDCESCVYVDVVLQLKTQKMLNEEVAAAKDKKRGVSWDELPFSGAECPGQQVPLRVVQEALIFKDEVHGHAVFMSCSRIIDPSDLWMDY